MANQYEMGSAATAPLPKTPNSAPIVEAEKVNEKPNIMEQTKIIEEKTNSIENKLDLILQALEIKEVE